MKACKHHLFLLFDRQKCNLAYLEIVGDRQAREPGPPFESEAPKLGQSGPISC